MSPSDEFAPEAPRRPPASGWSRLAAISFGFFGVFLGLLLWHGWVDHQQLHQMIQYINLQAPKINQLPAVP